MKGAFCVFVQGIPVEVLLSFRSNLFEFNLKLGSYQVPYFFLVSITSTTRLVLFHCCTLKNPTLLHQLVLEWGGKVKYQIATKHTERSHHFLEYSMYTTKKFKQLQNFSGIATQAFSDLCFKVLCGFLLPSSSWLMVTFKTLAVEKNNRGPVCCSEICDTKIIGSVRI